METQDERQYYLDQIAERDAVIERLNAELDEQRRLRAAAQEGCVRMEKLIQNEWQQHANTAWELMQYEEAMSTVWDALDKLQAKLDPSAVRGTL